MDGKEKKEKNPPLLDGSEKPIFSEKKNVIRLIGFLIAFAIAVTFITIGVVRIGHKDPGLYDVTVDADKDLPFYASGIHLKYDFTGSSDEIKAQMNSVKAAYAEALKQSYKWFDPKNVYPEAPNLAEISQKPGQAIVLQEPLFAILQDALQRTEKNEGYTIFAAPLRALQQSRLYANDPAAGDPINEPELRALIDALDQVIREDPGELILNAAEKTATLNLSAAYAAFLEEYELQDGILDLGVLADAYRLQYLSQVLEDAGYTNGFLTSDSGASILLSGYANEQAKYCLYSLDAEGKLEVSATKPASAGTASCNFRVFRFSEEENGFYTVATGEQILYRNPYQLSFPDLQPVLSVLAVSSTGKIVDAAYTCACLMEEKTASDALAFAKASGVDWLLDLNDGEAKLYLSGAEGVETLSGYETILPEGK